VRYTGYRVMKKTCRMCINGVNVCFGIGCFDEMLEDIALLGRRWYVVTTRGGSMERYGWIPRLREAAEKYGAEIKVCRCVSTNPTTAQADEAYRDASLFRATVVIGIGGGSAIDVAKAVAAGIASKAKPSELYRKARPIRGSVPLVAIPSTHGTGSEVDGFAVLSDEETKSKAAIVSGMIKPKIAVVDPRLTRTLPQPLAGATVVDAFSHAIESYVANNASTLSRGFAREALIAIGRGLRLLDERGWNDLGVREWFHYASMMAGVAIDLSRTTLLHALEHPISFYHPDIHHGIGLALLLPFWASIVSRHAGPDLVEAVSYLGLGISDPVEAVKRLVVKLLGETPSPASLGVEPAEAETIVADAYRYLEPLVRNTPGYPFDKKGLAEELRRYLESWTKT